MFSVFELGYMVGIQLSVALVCRLVVRGWPALGETPWHLLLLLIPLSAPVKAGEEMLASSCRFFYRVVNWLVMMRPRSAPTCSILMEAKRMRPPRVPLSIGLALFSVLLLASLTGREALHAQAPTAGTTASAPGQHWWVCQCHILKDPSQPVLGSLRYYALLTAPNNPSARFAAYLHEKYKIVMGGAATQGSGNCGQLSDVAANRANSMDMYQKAWAAGKDEVINTNWTDSPAESEAAAAAAPAAAATAQSSSGASATFFISCSTSGGAGIDTYYTGVFEIGAKPGRSPHPPNTPGAYIGGTWMVPAVLPQTVLDHFYEYLTQKGDKFKPGSSSACDVQPTEAAAKAAQHKRAYEGGGCSNCGKVVETGWKYTPGM